jgi:phosphopantetheine adenylyltransferase/dephospho-CoA kinase
MSIRKFFSIGLTGGIASGKSSARKYLGQAHGAHVIDADVLGHACYVPGHPCLDQVLDAFGRENLLTDGSLDRAKLGGIVFSDKSQLQKLNGIVWPHIRDALASQLTSVRQEAEQSPLEETTIVVVEAAVLLEAKWEDLFDEVWVVHVDPEAACERLMERNSLSLEEAQQRQGSQISNVERLSRCNVGVSNNNDLTTLQQILDKEFAKARVRASGMGLSSNEMLIVVDKETNEVLGAERRSVVKASQEMCYRATYVFVRKIGTEKLYVQRRSDLKDYCPGELDPVFGGCVGEGESYEVNAIRELEEELGVSNAKLDHLFTFLYDGARVGEPSIWGDVWETEIDADVKDLTLQPEEVDEVFLMLPEDVVALDDARNSDTPPGKRVTRDSAECLRLYMERRSARPEETGGKSKY